MNDKDRRFDKKEIKRAVAIAFPMGNIVFSTHLANAQTPYCPTHSKPMATAIRLLRADTRAGKGNRACSETLRKNRNQTVNGGVTFVERKTEIAGVFLYLLKNYRNYRRRMICDEKNLQFDRISGDSVM